MAKSGLDPQRSSLTSIDVQMPSANHSAGPSSRGGTPGDHFSVDLRGSSVNQTGPAPSPSPPQSSPVRSQRDQFDHSAEQREYRRKLAAATIERFWISHRDRQMFLLLKHSLCAAESSMTGEILRKMCPKEAEFLRDKSMLTRVRFRFGGSEFPPLIFFKLYTYTPNGHGVRYISGQKMIKPASEAAEDALRLMGSRQFLDQVVCDTIRLRQGMIIDEIDVTTLKDYMQYLSNLDELPAHLGGKENYWRKLNLNDLPRHIVFFDVMDFAYNHRMTPQLQEELPLLMARPLTREIQLQHIEAISKIRSPVTPYVPASTPTKWQTSQSPSQPSSRRSRQAKIRSLKMRQLYLDQHQGAVNRPPAEGNFSRAEEKAMEDFDMETEAEQLYEWTQTLNLNDEHIGSPMGLLSARS